MQSISKYFSWILSLILAILWGLSWYSSKATIEKKDAEIAAMQKQYQQLINETNNKVTEANKKAQQLAVDANSKIQQLAEDANEKIQLANQPEVPVQVSFRKALMSSGHVAGFTN